MRFRPGHAENGPSPERAVRARPSRRPSPGSASSRTQATPVVPRPQPEAAGSDRRDTLVRRVRAEFFEMPGMRLTLAQAQRLFGLPNDLCEWILAELTREGFLFRAQNGMFGRREFSQG